MTTYPNTESRYVTMLFSLIGASYMMVSLSSATMSMSIPEGVLNVGWASLSFGRCLKDDVELYARCW